jgi:hypothetical protein
MAFDFKKEYMKSSVDSYRTATGWNRFGNYQGKY